MNLALPAEQAHGPGQSAVDPEEKVSQENDPPFPQKKAEVTRRVPRRVKGDQAFKARNSGTVCQGLRIGDRQKPQPSQPPERGSRTLPEPAQFRRVDVDRGPRPLPKPGGGPGVVGVGVGEKDGNQIVRSEAVSYQRPNQVAGSGKTAGVDQNRPRTSRRKN